MGFIQKSVNSALKTMSGVPGKNLKARQRALTEAIAASKNLSAHKLERYHKAMSVADKMRNREKLISRGLRGSIYGGSAYGVMHGLADSKVVNYNNEINANYQNQLVDTSAGFAPDFYKQSSDTTTDDLRPNIPQDTTQPSSSNPSDTFDYFDYQELVNTEGMPDRSNIPALKDMRNKSPFKVAHEIGADLSVIQAMNDYLIVGMTSDGDFIKEAGISVPERLNKMVAATKKALKLTPNKHALPGSRLLGAAILSGAGGVTTYGLGRVLGEKKDIVHDYAK